ncbi:hypothetical protein [Actinoplanes sp. TBRC 11911]|uniref:hypothetical protein n=1 Tax=Actinoplanes sp. TBRC 11911 TaxID=2729386 RepID=UPI002007179A|nr:hypothetical protein [Actinoplanes sp. TBRC 11911]
MVTRPVYPNCQLPLTLIDTVKEGAGGGVVVRWAVGVGLVVGGRVPSGTPVEAARRTKVDGEDETDGECETVRDATGDEETLLELGKAGGNDVAEAAGSTATWGIDGSATAGWRDASAGPTARTATQTTKRTRIAMAKLMTIRAVLKGREECFAGNDRPSSDQLVWGGRLPRYAMPLARRPIARLISFWASRVAMSWRLS